MERRLIDGRGMLPPEPLELTLAALDSLRPGDELTLLLNCEPYPLYAILDRYGYRHSASSLVDGSREIRIVRGQDEAGAQP